MDKETTLLTRVTANHLFLSQFEAFRATILSLRRRNPELALSILQTIVANGGKIDNVIYSPNCSSFAILAWLCCIELLRFDDATSIWSLAPDELKLRVEFLLYVQMISSRVSERVRKILHLNLSENEGISDEAAYLCGKLNASMRVLDEITELGLRRLKEDLMVDDDRENADCFGGRVVEEEELVGLIGVNLENADVFEALCLNIQNQVREKERDNLGLAITLRRERRAASGEEDMRVLKWIQENVQMAHLDAMKAGLIENDIDGVARHIQYLHLDYGVAQAKYRYALNCLHS